MKASDAALAMSALAKGFPNREILNVSGQSIEFVEARILTSPDGVRHVITGDAIDCLDGTWMRENGWKMAMAMVIK